MNIKPKEIKKLKKRINNYYFIVYSTIFSHGEILNTIIYTISSFFALVKGLVQIGLRK